MKVIADVSVVPIGAGVSVRGFVKAAHKALVDADLNATLCPNATVVEGEYDDVSRAIKAAMEAVYAAGAQRITVTIRMSSRVDKDQSARDKIDAIEGN